MALYFPFARKTSCIMRGSDSLLTVMGNRGMAIEISEFESGAFSLLFFQLLHER